MKKLASILLTTTLAASLMCTPVFAETGKTVIFKGGDISPVNILNRDEGTYGTIELELTNIDSQANVKMDTKELMTYLDDDGTVDKVIYTDDDGKGYSINNIVKDLNNKGGIPVYYASSLPVITAEKPMTAFMTFWKGDDTTKATFSPKYWSFNDYLANEDKAKVYTTKPDGDWLFAPNTSEQINKTGRYLFVLHDNGAISPSPINIICVNAGETSTPVTNGKAANFTDNQTVDTNKTWTIKFTDAIVLDELTNQGITVTNSKGETVKVGIQLGQDIKTVTVTAPQDGYTPGENYILNLGSKTHSSKGKALKNEYKVHFNIKK